VTIRRVTRTITVIECVCARCGYVWTPRGKGKPARCAGCTVRDWDRPAKWRRPDLRRRTRKKPKK
jgi:predicted Zn-ribbon and HTH transcriptional regulator